MNKIVYTCIRDIHNRNTKDFKKRKYSVSNTENKINGDINEIINHIALPQEIKYLRLIDIEGIYIVNVKNKAIIKYNEFLIIN